MRLGVIGLPGAGIKTVFEALTQNTAETGHRTESRIGTVKVPDERVDTLSSIYQPKKTIYAQVEYLLPGDPSAEKAPEQSVWNQARDCDALIHVIRNFSPPGFEPPRPAEDFRKLDEELMIIDLISVEKRLERIEKEKKRGKKMNPQELSLLIQCRESLEENVPLRRLPDLAADQVLRGFAFLSAKPMLVLFNNDDENDGMPEFSDLEAHENTMIIKGRLEQELSQMSPDEAREFLLEFNITSSAMDRVIQRSYDLLGLISFFTVGEDEVRAWTIRRGTIAQEAAGVIHSDMQKGFIRAEVLAYSAFLDAGSFKAARQKGTVRLEGKTYGVEDGDLVTIRFNV